MFYLNETRARPDPLNKPPDKQTAQRVLNRTDTQTPQMHSDTVDHLAELLWPPGSVCGDRPSRVTEPHRAAQTRDRFADVPIGLGTSSSLQHLGTLLSRLLIWQLVCFAMPLHGLR